MSRTLFLLRHAQAVTDLARYADRDRPLDPFGEQHARRIGHWLASQNVRPELVLVSPARRTQSTARWVLDQHEGEVGFITDPRIYASSPALLRKIIAEVDPVIHALMIVGHNPEISRFAHNISEDIGEMPTGGMVMAEFSAPSWSAALDDRPLSARLHIL
jgi:phosphohistidine phosphatase